MANNIVTLQPNPYKSANLNIKLAKPRVNSAGYAITNMDGRIATSDEDVTDAVQIPGTMITLTPPLTARGLKTGLDEMVDNPYKDLTGYSPTWGEAALKDKEKISRQTLLEYKHGRAQGYYSNQFMDTITPSDKLHEQPFFLKPEHKTILDGATIFLNLDNPMDEVKYYYLRVHPKVAKSLEELDEGRSNKLYYIVHNKEVVDLKLDKTRKMNKAAAQLEDLNSRENDSIITMALAMGYKGKQINRNTAYKFIYVEYTNDTASFAKFMKFFEMLNDAGRRHSFVAHAQVQELINYNVVRMSNNKYYWIMPDTEETVMTTYEWSTIEDLINNFLINPASEKERDIMLSQLKGRKLES